MTTQTETPKELVTKNEYIEDLKLELQDFEEEMEGLEERRRNVLDHIEELQSEMDGIVMDIKRELKVITIMKQRN